MGVVRAVRERGAHGRLDDLGVPLAGAIGQRAPDALGAAIGVPERKTDLPSLTVGTVSEAI